MAMTDPMDALNSFQQAHSAGELKVQQCDVHTGLLVYKDTAQGVLRLTYAKVEADVIEAVAVLVIAEPVDGERCFGIAYATRETHRGRGFATSIASAAIDELTNGFTRNGIMSFNV